jgi:hypothetical protein
MPRGLGRQPRGYIIVNGTKVPCVRLDVTQSRSQDPDIFNAEIAIGAAGLGLNFWADASSLPVEVMMSNDIGAGAVKMFGGSADGVFIQLLKRTVLINGRGKEKALIDTKVQQKYLNQTPDQIVKKEAQKVGLKVDMDEIKDKAGKIWQLDWNKFFHNHSLWTGISNLADNFGMNAYATNGTLYFKNLNEQLNAYEIKYEENTTTHPSNVIDLQLAHDLVVAQGVSVDLKSWDNKAKKVVSALSGSQGSGSLNYLFTVPGLTQEQAQTIADKKQAEASAHEMVISAEMPGDTAMDARLDAKVSGTGTSFDKTFETLAVQHRISVHEDFRMTIYAKTGGSGGDSGGGSGESQ